MSGTEPVVVNDQNDPKRWVTVTVGGKTPGERATAAKAMAEPIIQKILDSEKR